MPNVEYTSYLEALQITLEILAPLHLIERPVIDSLGHITARSIAAKVNAPSLTSSLRDGYAVRAEDIAFACEDAPVRLPIAGMVAAGEEAATVLEPGTALRILTGAPVPTGADTVVAEEFVNPEESQIAVPAPTARGYNILQQATDIAAEEQLLPTGKVLTPGDIGLLAAGGHATVPIFPKPRVALIATGDEILLPGQPMRPGKLYASNLLTLNAWCQRYGYQTAVDVVGDETAPLTDRLQKAIAGQDVVITSGGAWSGDRDLMARVLNDMGWQKQYHRVRLGPGKAVGFGILNQKPIFILPGGPPSNLVAFLMLALPGLLRLSGHPQPGLPQVNAQLMASVSGKVNWTQAIFGSLHCHADRIDFEPHDRTGSRLKRMAQAQGLLLLPEGKTRYEAGEPVVIHSMT